MILLKTLSQSLEDELVWLERNTKLKSDNDYSYVDHPDLEISSLVLSGSALPPLRLGHNLRIFLIMGQMATMATRVHTVSQQHPYLDWETLRTLIHTLVNLCLLAKHSTWNWPWNYLEAGVGWECSCITNYGHIPVCPHTYLCIVSCTKFSVGFSVQFKLLVMCYKMLHGIEPGYLRDYICSHSFLHIQYNQAEST